MICYSVSDFSGSWSLPFLQGGFDVYRFDPKLIKSSSDRLYPWTAQTMLERISVDVPGHCDVLLMAPPCTDFSIACNRLWSDKDNDGRTAASLEIIDACLELVKILQPTVWALENPVGRLWGLRPVLGKAWYFQPCDFGDPYTKKTGLVGNFVPPLPLFVGSDMSVKPDVYYSSDGRKESYIEQIKGKDRRSARSKTPSGFARAFYLANKLQLSGGAL